MVDDLTEGTIDGWPVYLAVERDLGQAAYGMHCAPYTGEDDEPSPDAIMSKCWDITDACYGLKPAAALRRAKSMGFVPD